MSDSELMLDNSYANRMEGLFYSKSDEKFTVRALLDQIFANRSFERALDVGAGRGHITEPLARRTRQLVLVDRNPGCEEILKQQFPNAKIVVSEIDSAPLVGKFDVVLCSHFLYYQRTDTWVPFCERLLNLLSDSGELLIVLNSDSGDWWKIISHYSATLGNHVSFHYKPLSQFKRELNAFAQVQAHPYRFQVWIEPGEAWTRFIGKQILEIEDESLLEQHALDFAQFAKQFKQIDGSVVMEFRSEIVRIRKR